MSKEIKEIIESYHNGQTTQMLQQIWAYGPYETASDLAVKSKVDKLTAMEIMRRFMMYGDIVKPK